MWVLDASVAVKWFFRDEPLRKEADLVLDAVVRRPDDFLVPDMFYIETTAVINRKSKRDENFCKSALDSLYELGIPSVPVGREIMEMAVEAACARNLTVYDAIYVALAKTSAARWLSADEQAIARLDSSQACKLASF